MENNNIYYQPQNPYQYNKNYNPNIYIPKKKDYEPFEKKDNTFLFVLFAVLFLFFDFAVFTSFGLGFTITYFLLFIVSTVYLFEKGNKPDAFSLICGVLSLAGAVSFTLYCNDFINTIMFFLIAGLFTLYCLGISGSYMRSRGNFKLLFDLVFSAVIHPLENMSAVIGGIKAGNKKNKKKYSVVFGILLAVPVLAVIIPLLIKSDAAFEALIKAIAKNIGQYLAQIGLAAIVTPFFFSYFYGKRKKLNADKNSELFTPKRVFPVSGSVSFLSVISVTYLVYLFSQLAYFFSAFKGILPEGYKASASEFARRGFYEMFAICAINVIIISVIGMLTKRENGKTSASVKCLSLFISLFSILLLATAIQKMKLNITTYGFTRNRLLVFTFMIMMLVVIAFFIVHIFAPKVNYMQPIIIICSVIFLALSFANIDNVTYKYNFKAYESGNLKKVDMYTVSKLCPSETYYIEFAKNDKTDEAHKAITRMIEETFVNKRYMTELEEEDNKDGYRIKDGKITKKNKDFRYFNVAEMQSEKKVKDYFNSLSQSEKTAFEDTYKKLYKFEYNYDKDIIVDYEYNVRYKFNEKTGKYDIKEDIRND